MSSLWVTFRLYQNHTPSNSIWLLLKPLFGIVIQLNTHCANLSALGKLNRNPDALNRIDLDCSEGSFTIRAQVKNLTSFYASLYDSTC